MMVPEKYCNTTVDSPPVSDTASSCYEGELPKAVSWITSPDGRDPDHRWIRIM